MGNEENDNLPQTGSDYMIGGRHIYSAAVVGVFGQHVLRGIFGRRDLQTAIRDATVSLRRR